MQWARRCQQELFMVQHSKLIAASAQRRGCCRLPQHIEDAQQASSAEVTPRRGRHRRPPWYIRLWLLLHHER
jgi:hypothetical protein